MTVVLQVCRTELHNCLFSCFITNYIITAIWPPHHAQYDDLEVYQALYLLQKSSVAFQLQHNSWWEMIVQSIIEKDACYIFHVCSTTDVRPHYSFGSYSIFNPAPPHVHAQQGKAICLGVPSCKVQTTYHNLKINPSSRV